MIARTIYDLPNNAASRWLTATVVLHTGRHQDRRMVYRNQHGEYLAYSTHGGYVGPFATQDAAMESFTAHKQ